ARVDGVIGSNLAQSITVRCCTHDCLGPNVAACTWSIFNNEWLPQPLSQPLSHHTRNDVPRAAGRKVNDNAHWPRRIGLGSCNARHGRQRSSARGQMQKLPSGKLHGALRNQTNGSLRLDAGELDDLPPFFDLLRDEFAEVSGRTWKHHAAQIGKSCFDL